MAIAGAGSEKSRETDHPTKRVFMRAERDDVLHISDVCSKFSDLTIPDALTVVKRDLTYYGPKLRLSSCSASEQYRLTIPGPESQAILWQYSSSGWKSIAEVCLEFSDSYPQYDICLHCNEPISTVEHRRRSVIGACTNS